MDKIQEIVDLIPRYRAYARSLTTDHGEADDLVSEVTLKMIERDVATRDHLDIEAYGIRAIKNTLIDRRRLAFNDHESIDDEAFGLDVHISNTEFKAPNPESSLMFDQLLERIRALGADCQKVMLLFFIEGNSYLEIASQLDWEPSTVGTRLLRCKKSFIASAGDFL